MANGSGLLAGPMTGSASNLGCAIAHRGISRFRAWSFGPSRNDDINSLQPRFLNLRRRHQGRGIAPGIADVVRDIGDLLIRQLLGVSRHRSGIGCARRGYGLCTVEDDTQRAGGVDRLQIGVAGKWRIDPRAAAAIGLMAGDTGVGVDRFTRCYLGLRRRGHRGIRLSRRKVLEVDRDGANIGVAHLRGRIGHDLSHQSAGMALAVAAALQILDDVIDAPRFEPAALRAVEPGSEPTLHQTAPESAATLVGAENVLGGVAGAAMRRARDEITAAIPFRAFLLVRLEYAGPEEQEIPGAHDDAVI